MKAVSELDKIYEGVVMYCSQSMIDNIHLKDIEEKGVKKSNEYHSKYVTRKDDVPYINNYLNLLLMKRDAFKHENETRFFVIKNDKIGLEKAQRTIEGDKVYWGETILLSMDWVDVIDKVYINAKEDSWEYQLLSNALRKKIENAYLNNNSLFEDEEENPFMHEKMEQIWNERLKPVPYFVYGEDLDKPLVMDK